MHRAALGLAAALLASPAAAQMTQYWLPNGPGGTTYNNPQGSLSGTHYNNALRRHADQHRWARERQGAAGGSYAGAASRNPSFRLTNSGGRTIREVYVSPVTEDGWGRDRLGRDVLPPGQATVVQLPTGQCLNDVRVVFADGQAQERRRIDTCALSDMTFR